MNILLKMLNKFNRKVNQSFKFIWCTVKGVPCIGLSYCLVYL